MTGTDRGAGARGEASAASTTTLPLTGAPARAVPLTSSGAGGIGASIPRPDGRLKAQGRFAFSSDLWAEGMIWGHTLRSPHAHARIHGIDVGKALAVDGVLAVLTAADIPGTNAFGLMVADQPVLAESVVRYQGEPVALVAAADIEIARYAATLIDVQYEALDVVSDATHALDAAMPLVHPSGNLIRDVVIRRGDQSATADVVITGSYSVGMQDQAPMGTESGLAMLSDDGGVEVHVNTQWLHADRNQLATILDMPPEMIRLRLAGVGGAFGSREDLTMQAHLCLLALHTGRPVKMVYGREESFFGHVHRHPAVMRYEHGATRDGRLVYARCTILLDGGAYASTSPAVVSNAASFAVGPYDCPHVEITARAVYTNNPPCGAMRGFGAVQVAFAHESQMDRLAAALDLDPIEVRMRNAMTEGSLMPTGQPVTGGVPVRELLEALKDMPMPQGEAGSGALPGGAANVTHGEGVRRGVGYGLGFKAGGIPEGARDFSTARIRLFVSGDEAVAQVHTAAVEMGQGLTSVQLQVARSELGIGRVIVMPADTAVGSAGTSSASRQTYMTGGAVREACLAVRERLVQLAQERFGHRWPQLLEGDGEIVLRDEALWGPDGERLGAISEVLQRDEIVEERRFYHWRTTRLDPHDGQGNPHVQFIFAAHRAVVDVDTDTGLCRVVEMGVVQDVGRAVNPVAVEGQMEGGTTQGIGLALMEQIQLKDGLVLNPSFTDYLIPTTLDVPPMRLKVFEFADPKAPYGIKGAGEQSTISSTPAVVAALRSASGKELVSVPVLPEELVDFPDPDDVSASGTMRAMTHG